MFFLYLYGSTMEAKQVRQPRYARTYQSELRAKNISAAAFGEADATLVMVQQQRHCWQNVKLEKFA